MLSNNSRRRGLTRIPKTEVETEMGALSTENLYLGAFALSQGAELKRVVLSRSNGRTTAVFELEGQDVETLVRTYWEGSAIVNLAQFRESLEGLKDRLFEALRENETRRRQDHDQDDRRHASSRR
jgi:hypothetical protein